MDPNSLKVQPAPEQPESSPSSFDVKRPAPIKTPTVSPITHVPHASPTEDDNIEPEVHSSSSHEGLKSILTTLAILVLAPLIAFALTAFIFQSYQVEGQSMETTLQNGDRLIVLKLPRTWSKITRHAYIPHRSDVIIFNKNNLYQYDGANQKKQLVKRVIGLPGDRVVVSKGEVIVYNSDHPSGFNPDKTYPYGKAIITTPGTIDTTVGTNQVFVMGDNRQNSLDSRIFGPISDGDIVGKLQLRIFPFNKFKEF
jgi:signal peptidase I